MYTEETFYSIALRHCPLIGDFYFKKIVSITGSAKEAWILSKNELKKQYGIGSKISEEIGKDSHLFFAENELKLCKENNINIHLSHVGESVGLLSQCDDAPAILYTKGNLDYKKNNISIVGTRKISKYGSTFISEFLQALKCADLQTISGLAIGADSYVHEESIKNNIPTVAVLAHGFNTLYPAKNKSLADKILETGGCLMTEFSYYKPPIRESFVHRNRIIAGISPSTIIVETAYSGGSISTANFANVYNREVLALPGDIYSKYSQGCNLLISQNKARIIVSVQDAVNYLDLVKEPVKQLSLFDKKEIPQNLSPEQQQVLSTITETKDIGIDEISEKLNLPTYKILPIVLDLEILGLIKTSSMRKYNLI